MKKPVYLIAGGGLALHLLLAAAIPVFDDEAYYWLWSRDLAWGYYDHPPMVAYFIRAGTALLGDGLLGVRALACLGAALAALALADMVRRMGGGARAQNLAAALLMFGPISFPLGGFATPDAPLLLFWSVTLWAALRAVQGGGWRIWLVTGALLGLAGLSKFTAAFLGFGLLLWIGLTGAGRIWALRARPYAAMAMCLLVLLPYFLWNIDHDWLGFERQAARLETATGNYMLAYAILLLAISPFGCYAALQAIWRKQSEPGQSILLLTVLPLAAFFLFGARQNPVQANWLLPLQINLTALAALWLENRPRLALLGVCFSSLGGLGVMALAFNPFFPFVAEHNPPNQTRGWPSVAVALQENVDAHEARWIATGQYGLTGQLAYRLAPLPVYDLTEPWRYGFRAPFPAELCAAKGLLVLRAGEDPAAFFPMDDIKTSQTISRAAGEITLDQLTVYPVHGAAARLCAR